MRRLLRFFRCVFFFFFKQKTAYEISACLVGSEMCIRDRLEAADIKTVDDFYHSKWKAVQELMKAKSRLPEKSQKVFAKALKLLWSEGNKTVRKTVKQVVGEKRR